MDGMEDFSAACARRLVGLLSARMLARARDARAQPPSASLSSPNVGTVPPFLSRLPGGVGAAQDDGERRGGGARGAAHGPAHCDGPAWWRQPLCAQGSRGQRSSRGNPSLAPFTPLHVVSVSRSVVKCPTIGAHLSNALPPFLSPHCLHLPSPSIFRRSSPPSRHSFCPTHPALASQTELKVVTSFGDAEQTPGESAGKKGLVSCAAHATASRGCWRCVALCWSLVHSAPPAIAAGRGSLPTASCANAVP